MEEPSEKQIAFAKKLGIDNPEQFTKKALSELISKKADKQPEKTEKIDEKYPVAQEYPKKGYHLTPEQVRTNAMEFAFKWRETLKGSEQEQIDVFQAAKKFEEYING